ncbi:hypothetical protein CPU12_02045 [Malaciobacter molluscorum LMG 25693]|uniref:Flagellar hook-length control protein FliK n=1 Tax=Malaciobacter molluscorum LMG 25693 TaxID=870501 RepID=A0A2G1DKP3_9BACT|nr:flagellar hook-length control protein FliK [Malaciobacter molluscorum]AXX92627.1 flagellar hook-length control protein FliK [Malaciobacter molluscorum LMG 25693]PHO19051.1 hypothetical protein CPU12_02045 [Malaciobacter molluscorum LMG 25693]
MIVGNSNTLLNILLPNQDNKALKDVLKEADSKELNNMLKNNASIKDVLANLFEDIKNSNKSNETIQNILKNSSIFKDLGNFTSNIKTLFSQIPDDSSFAKYKPLLQSFLLQLENLDENNLKELLSKSGVFLESKMLNKAANGTIPTKLMDVLNQIQNIIKNIDTPQAKQLNDIITKLISNPNQNISNLQSDIKSVLNLLQDISRGLNDKNTQNITNLTNQLKSLTNDAQLLESQIQNNSQTQKLTNLVDNLKSQLINIQTPQTNSILLKLENIMQQPKQVQQAQIQNLLTSNEFQNISNKVPDIANTAKNISNLLLSNSNINTQIEQNSQKEQIQNQLKNILIDLKSEVLSNRQVQPQQLLSKIDNILNMNDLFANDNKIEPKNLLQQLLNSSQIKEVSIQNPNISTIVDQLKTLTDNISTIENKINLNQPILTNEKTNLLEQLKQNLSNLKNELLNINLPQNSNLTQVIDKLINMQNLFDKIEFPNDLKLLQPQSNNISSFQSNFVSNINNLLLNLKESINTISANPNAANIQNHLLETIDKIENFIKDGLLNQANLLNNQKDNSSIQNDMKSVLLQMQDDILSKMTNDSSLNDVSKNVDKLLLQVDYYQLLSLTSNSNYVYLPFLWDMLEDGSISMKKANEKKFYCEINLTLKDFGQVQLLLALYDKNKLDLTIFASRESFKKLVRENLTTLKQSLNAARLIPMDIKLIDLEKRQKQQEKPKEIYQNSNSSYNVGIDIRA